MINYTQKDINRFYNKINIIEEGPNKDCWEIDCGKGNDGYPIFSIKSYPILANRFMYQIHHPDEIIEGLLVCHSCDHPWCVNPEHLWLGTNEDNMNDMVNKNRQAKGSVNGNSKLTDKSVEEILINIQSGCLTSVKEIMKRYAVGNFTVYGILNENYWLRII
jgi:hypothetical protein